jgi:hypothetical protein
MHTAQIGTSEVAIFGRVLDADHATLTVPAALTILTFGFGDADKDRMRELSSKANQGTLTEEEQEEINNYEKVGHMLSLMKSKARCVLKKAGVMNAPLDR